MRFRFLLISCLILFFISGCFFLPESVRTLKKVGVGQDDIEAMFTNNLQEAADTIRQIGYKYYSDRVSQHETVIQ